MSGDADELRDALGAPGGLSAEELIAADPGAQPKAAVKASAEVEPLPPGAGGGEDQGPPPDTGELLDSIASAIRRYVVVSDAQRDVMALWALHTHAIDAADTTPYLDISSPEKESGKSRLLEVQARLVPRAMETANVSDAALFRALSGEDGPATLLYDEVDSIFGRNAARTKEEQRGLLPP